MELEKKYVCELLGITYRTLMRWLENGKLGGLTIEDLLEYKFHEGRRSIVKEVEKALMKEVYEIDLGQEE